jgi:hypothetical protein
MQIKITKLLEFMHIIKTYHQLMKNLSRNSNMIKN